MDRKSAVEIDDDLDKNLAKDDPLRATQEKFLESGVGCVAPKKAVDPYRDAQQQLKTATNDLARSQSALNHQRTLLLQAREKVQKLEAAVVLAEQACQQKVAAQQAAHQVFEGLVRENKLSSAAASLAASQAMDVEQSALERVRLLEQELLVLRQALAAKQPVPEGNAAPTAAPAAPPAPPVVTAAEAPRRDPESASANSATSRRSRSPPGDRKKARVATGTAAQDVDIGAVGSKGDPELVLLQARRAAEACQQARAGVVPTSTATGPASSAPATGSACG